MGISRNIRNGFHMVLNAINHCFVFDFFLDTYWNVHVHSGITMFFSRITAVFIIPVVKVIGTISNDPLWLGVKKHPTSIQRKNCWPQVPQGKPLCTLQTDRAFLNIRMSSELNQLFKKKNGQCSIATFVSGYM